MSKRAGLIATLCVACAASPLLAAEQRPPDNDYWWPNRLNLEPLRNAAATADPMGPDFRYADAVAKLDVAALKKDLVTLMKTSQDWWPADYRHYGPFFIRMSWHAAGTYRAIDGRGGGDGGMQRFAPLNSWPDNASLDKARRLLLPIKQKYGNAVSWADLMVYAGTVAMEDMGFKTLGFAFGRADEWIPEEVNWGLEGEWLTDKRHSGNRELAQPFGATQMGLIYVNPEGPNGNPDPLAAARDIRQAFGRMGMDDEETAALIVGGHTFGKTHGARKADCIGADPEAASLEQQGLGWHNKCGTGKGSDTTTSGLEGAWTVSPAQWTHNFLENLYRFEWELTTSPAGAKQWTPKDKSAGSLVPDAHDPTKRHAPMMLTTDISLRTDPSYRKITQRWLKEPKALEDAFARAWYKLTHRDMGPTSRYLGPLVPSQKFIWQDPVPDADKSKQISNADVATLKTAIAGSGLSTAQLVRTAWASAVTYRGTDMRGGANGARIRLAPQKDWAANEPQELASVLKTLEGVQKNFNSKSRTQVSLADLIVLGGVVGVEQAAKKGGRDVTVPFTAGRTDASQEMTDVTSFAMLEPQADGFRNYLAAGYPRPPAEALVERAALLGLTVPEMTALVGGMRVLGANHGGSQHGVFTSRPGTLSNDFFVNLVDMSTEWSKSSSSPGIYEAKERATGKVKWTATPVDLVFGSNSELRAIAEFYASDDSRARFVDDFVKAWSKVMNAGRFDLT